MSAAQKNRGGFLIHDTAALRALHDDILYEVSRLSGHNDDAAILRRVRVLAYWITATAEAAFGSDPEKEALDAIDADLARIFGGAKGDADDR
jgi:hypothetical protein